MFLILLLITILTVQVTARSNVQISPSPLSGFSYSFNAFNGINALDDSNSAVKTLNALNHPPNAFNPIDAPNNPNSAAKTFNAPANPNS